MSDDRRLPDGGLPAYRGDGPDTTVSFGSVEPVDVEAPAVGLTSDESAAVHALPPTSALLIMQRGPSSGARFLLDAERTTAGRSTSADIFLDDVTVSRRHAEFSRTGDGEPEAILLLEVLLEELPAIPAGTVRSFLKPGKVFLFDKTTGARILFGDN